MSSGILLTNPDLNTDRVTLTASGQRSQRAGDPVEVAGNSGLAQIYPSGDANTVADQTLQLLGIARHPLYVPNGKWTAPTTFATVDEQIINNDRAAGHLAVVRDRLWGIVSISGGTPTVEGWVWNGTDFVKKAEVLGDFGSAGACGWGDSAYIATIDLGNNFAEFWELKVPGGDPDAAVIRRTAAAFISVTNATGIRVAYDGSVLVVMVQIRETGPTKNYQRIFAGPTPTTLKEVPVTFLDLFGTTWNANNSLDKIDLKWSPFYGFVAVMRANAGASSTLKLATSPDGEQWTEFQNYRGEVTQPGGLGARFGGSGNANLVALSIEEQRIFVYRATSTGVEESTTTDVKMILYDGDGTWSSDVDADGGLADLPTIANAQLSAVNHRGAQYVGWRSESPTAKRTVRKNNDLTASDTGLFRELRFGAGNFLAGVDDDTGRSISFLPTGVFVPSDSWTIPIDFQFPVRFVLSDLLGEEWRTDDNGNAAIVFDAGANSVFVTDAIALFGVNVPTLKFQMHTADSWATPSFDQALSAVLSTATFASSTGNRIVVSTSPWEPSEFAGRRIWVQLSTGIFRVLDNDASSLIIDGAPGSPSGTVTVFGDTASYVAGSVNAYRYARLYYSTAYQTPDNYYGVRRILFGLSTPFVRCYSSGYQHPTSQPQTIVELPSGARIVTPYSEQQRESYDLQIPLVEESTGPYQRKRYAGIFRHAQGAVNQVVLWPKGADDLTGALLGRLIGDLGDQHRAKTIHDLTFRFEQEIG